MQKAQIERAALSDIGQNKTNRDNNGLKMIGKCT